MRYAVISILLLTAKLAAAETNRCELKITSDAKPAGGMTLKAEAPSEDPQSKVSAKTDYWISEDKLRRALQAMAEFGGQRPPEEVKARVDAAMKKDPRFMLLLLSCNSDEASAVFAPAPASRYADVPLKPGSYSVVADNPKPGNFTVLFSMYPGGNRETYTVKGPSKLVFTQFDRKALAGTFSLKAEQPGKAGSQISVTGRFKFFCNGDNCQK